MRPLLKVTPYDRTRYLVESQRAHENVQPYLVEMMAHGGNGECPCENFQREKLPFAEAQKNVPISKRQTFRCIHLIDAAEYCLREYLYTRAQLEKPPEHPEIIGAVFAEWDKVEDYTKDFYKQPI